MILILLLFGWQFFRAYQAGQERDEIEHQLTFQRMATDLALATIEASYGSYEGARELASSFYTRLQDNVQRAPPEGQEQIQSLLEQRDAVITALSRRDPASSEILARMFLRYRRAIGEPERAQIIPAPSREAPPPDTAGDTAGVSGGDDRSER